MTSLPPHTWQVPVVEDMVWDGQSSLTEAVVTSPSWAILFYGWWSLGEGLSLGEAWDATFTLSGAICWVWKQAQLNTNPVSLGEGWWLITQAITKWCIEPREHPHSIPPASAPFNFHNKDQSPWAARPPTPVEWWGEPKLHPKPSYQEWGQALQKDWGQEWWELWADPPLPPLPSPDCGFKIDWSSASTSSSVSSRSDRSGGSRPSHWGWCHCRESGAHMKINLPVFKDEDMKDTVTYQSWHWDLMVYCHAGCQDCTLLPYVICSLQDYPGELVRSLGTDITLDDILTILDEHYNNVKALDALNQGFFQLQMGEKETVLDWGVCLSRHLQVLVVSFPECFPLDHIAELKHGGLPKWLKAMVVYLKASTNEKMYSDYLWGSKGGWERRGNGTIL